MKSSMKKLLIILAVTMVISLGIAAIVMVTTGNFTVATEKINESKTFKPEEISEIEVSLVSTDLNIIPTTRGEIIVHFYGEVSTNIKRNIPELVAYKTGDKLFVETLTSKDIIVFGFNIERTTMDIYIPEIMLEEFKINVVSGDVIMQDIETAQLNLKTVSGDIKIEELIAEKIRTSSTSGDIIVNDYTGDMDASSTSGDISLTDGRENEDVDASTVSGDILIEQDAVSDMKLGSTSGDIRVKLPEDSQFYLDINTVSGDIKQDFSLKVISSGRRDLEGEVGDGDERIMVHTVSGDVTISY
jgi:lia operon protein LiaG